VAIRVSADRTVSSGTPELQLVAISKRFRDVLALDQVDMRVQPGTVHALLGENGAGKTSLMRIAYGMLSLDTGTVRLNGRPVRFRSPADAIRNGIGMVHQHFSLIPNMSAVENFALGGRGRYSYGREAQRLTHYAAELGLSIGPNTRAHAMSPAEQQQLEIAKALGRECRLLILDEPTAVLPPVQAVALLNWLRRFADMGRSVVLITHKLRDAAAVATDVTVLRQGRAVLSASMAGVTEAELLTAMLGDTRPDTQAEPKPNAMTSTGETVGSPAAVALLQSITAADGRERLDDVSLAVASGEMVGIAGLDGSGHRLLLRILAGRRQTTRGSVRIPAAVGFVPEDRQREALALSLDVRENVALRGAGFRNGWIRWRRWTNLALQLMRDFDVRARDARISVRTLSGGNQQKLVLARELSDRPTLIVAENPTRGLDVRATSEIRRRLRAARDAGAAVVLYSSDLDELAADSDRVLAVYSGRVRACELSRDAIGRAMLGAI
jgi:ABC-type uncharacterized transport system ATPase subunit